MAMKPIRYAVAGLGRAGWNLHIEQLRCRADAKIVAVVDSAEDRRAQAAAELACETYSHFSDLLRQDNIEAVVIATPSIQHAPQALEALAAGKHVIVEKPMALNVRQADRMIAAASAANRKLFVHQSYRFSPLAGHLQEVLRSGILGELYHVRASMGRFFRRNDWQTLVKNGGGELNNTGPHLIDLILQLMGAPAKQVMGDLRRVASAGDAEDFVKALIRGANGVTADLEIGNAQNVAASEPNWVLYGTHGTLTCTSNASIIRWFDPRQAAPLEAIDAPVFNRRYGNDDRLPWQEKTMPAEAAVSENFYDNVYHVLRENRPMRVTPRSVREVMRVMAMIRKGTPFTGKTTPSRRAVSSPTLRGHSSSRRRSPELANRRAGSGGAIH